MSDLERSVDRIASRTAFSAVVRVDRGAETGFAKAYGFAHRGWGIPNEIDTRFGIASGTKGLTALTVMSLVGDGGLSLSTTARSVLGSDLPLIHDAVTVEHLLAHRSGIGDYFRRGDRARHQRLRDAHLRPRARIHRGVPPSPRGVRDQVPAGRAVRVQQRRLRGARADRRAHHRGAVPRSGATMRVRTRRDA